MLIVKLIIDSIIMLIMIIVKLHYFSEAAKNVQVADALIRYSHKIFPAPLSLAVPEGM